YLVNRLGDNTADYEFLGDSYFDTEFIQQQIVASTGQTFLGSSYETANEQMELLLDNAVSESNALDLTFGVALTASQQAALNGSVVNEDQLNTFMVDGGKAQSLGAQGTITSGGDAQIYAAKDITFDGGSLSALGDTTLVAGQGITLGSVAASASQDIEQHDYSHRAAETENFGA
ncbi:hypothetical protein, partial [Komagataeibacter diospyri]|uniref:hypothetical protein n=1 Tax=Komagataeibacter diospyri TaxID=1932662 RepID=UPI001396C65B